MTVALTLALGTVIGSLLGLLGGGGSILAVPVLVYALGIPLEQAVPMSLIVVGIASLFGSIPKVTAREVQWPVAAVFAATGFLAAFAGSAVNRMLPPSITMTGFAIVMVVAGIRMLTETGGTGTACRAVDSTVNWRRCTSRAIPAGLGVGFLTGLFGVGGGFLIVPALVLLLGITMPVAVGTSLVIVSANSASGVLAYLGDLTLDWGLVVAFTSTAIAGSFVAGRFGKRINTAQLQKWFAYLIFAVAGFVVLQV
jgi:uncharacterized membrane protein YfcA